VVRPASPVPAQPKPPPPDPGRPTVGGDGLATAGLTVPAGAPPVPGNLSATSWLVADLDTGAVLGACGPHVPHPPASVQKLLLAETLLAKLDPAQVVEVTQADLAIIARADFARDDFRRYDTARTAQIPAQPPKDPRGFQIQNEDRLLYNYPGALGGKTGFTDLARHTFVGAAERGGRRLVVTLL